MAASYNDVLRKLGKLNAESKWTELRDRAIKAADEFPESADVAAYAAHAMRQLQELEEGYQWAVRATTIDATNLFGINRVSLLANLTKRYQEGYATAEAVLDRVPANAGDAQNIAVTLVNAIHAASHLGLIAEAIERFTPAIVRLDHADLHFNSACMYALANDSRAFDYVAKSLATQKPKTAFADTDFDAIRADARFVELLARDWGAETSALSRARVKDRALLRPEDFVAGLEAGEPDHERHDGLERAIDANIDDVDAYLVYSDWLQGQGNPRGHFILASKRCDDARTESERMLAYVDWAARLQANAGAWLGDYAPYHRRNTCTTWHLGFVCELAFDLGYSKPLDAGALLAETLALPVCRFVRGIAIGDVPASEQMSYDAVVEALQGATVPHLRSLEIAPADFQMSWTSTDISALALPGLESLVIGGGEITTGALAFPALRRFAIRTGGLSQDSLEAIIVAEWPRLEDLEVWFGDEEWGATEVDETQLTALMARPVRRLGLMNASFTDQICEVLLRTRALPRLEVLDLSMGTLSDAGAELLMANRQHFAHLTKLVLDDNCMSEIVADRVCGALPNASVKGQKPARYVSVGE